MVKKARKPLFWPGLSADMLNVKKEAGLCREKDVDSRGRDDVEDRNRKLQSVIQRDDVVGHYHHITPLPARSGKLYTVTIDDDDDYRSKEEKNKEVMSLHYSKPDRLHQARGTRSNPVALLNIQCLEHFFTRSAAQQPSS